MISKFFLVKKREFTVTWGEEDHDCRGPYGYDVSHCTDSEEEARDLAVKRGAHKIELTVLLELPPTKKGKK